MCDFVREIFKCRICTVSFSLYNLGILLPFLPRWQLENKAMGISLDVNDPSSTTSTPFTMSTKEDLHQNPSVSAHRWGGLSNTIP